MNMFGNKSFLRHQAQAFGQFPFVNAYQAEENEFLKNVQIINRQDVPRDANIISSHTIYKIKLNDDSSLKLKARIAPHGNEDCENDIMKSDCCMCSPIGIRILISIATFRGCRVIRIYVKTAFLQSIPANRNVYVIPPRESQSRGVLWVLLAAAYGLVNSNAKWQVKSDDALTSLSLVQSSTIPQLFLHFYSENHVDLVVIKMADAILATGTDCALRSFAQDFGKKFNLAEITHGPGRLRFFGLKIIQHEDFSCSIDGDEKLNALEPYQLSLFRRPQSDEKMNAIEQKAFMSIKARIGWLGITSSVLCAF